MSELIINSLKFIGTEYDGGKAIRVSDQSNKHEAVLRLNGRKKFYVVPNTNTFPIGGKRYYEMLYIAEVNKERLYGKSV